MSGPRRPPQARDRLLGALLRTLRRQHTTMNLMDAAHAAQISSATLSRTENGRRHIEIEDVAVLLTLYGVPAAQRSELINEVRADIHHFGQWVRPFTGMSPDTALSSLETSAAAVTSWSTIAIPSLLHTQGYGIAAMIADGHPPDEAEDHWAARNDRQNALGSTDYTAYIHETALHTPHGGVAVLGEQLRHLAEAANRGVGVRVVRATDAVGLSGHSWTLLAFPDDPPVAHIRLHRSSVFLHGPESETYHRHTTRLRHVALSTADTGTYIRQVRARLGGDRRSLIALRQA
ncbi:helix-turn-helix domain-containing protein [Actinokineospora guangxiensis]|uniref:Helix-turn-helix domain-containing protein n=1 Tax=Actinokineospora guangxiensis TaxID=1490288 RepID=A0ABW0EUU5_9PSEU